MLLHKTGDLLCSGEPAIAHGVNCKGVMGAGIAKPIRDMYPDRMYDKYRSQCYYGVLRPGGVQMWVSEDLPTLFNLATQDSPGADAHLSYVLRSVDCMLKHATTFGVKRIGMPRIGCGIGGLKWERVEPILEALTEEYPTVDLIVYTLLED